jgi:hypothetical protein
MARPEATGGGGGAVVVGLHALARVRGVEEEGSGERSSCDRWMEEA